MNMWRKILRAIQKCAEAVIAIVDIFLDGSEQRAF